MILALLFSTVLHAQPKCSEIADDSGKKDAEVCYESFKKTPPPPGHFTAKQICDCVANSILTDLTCEDIKRYRHDEKFAEKTRKHIAHNCIHDLTSAR